MEKAFPLIVIFGREPNGSCEKMEEKIGDYDFDKDKDSRKCSFWNNSHGLLAEYAQKATAEFKRICRDMQASPIVYAYSLPICINYNITHKSPERKKVTPDRIQAHIEKTFSYDVIFKRCNLILLSGLNFPFYIEPDFSESVKLIEQHARKCQIKTISVPFFYGRNRKDIRQRIEKEDGDRFLSKVVNDFLKRQFQ